MGESESVNLTLSKRERMDKSSDFGGQSTVSQHLYLDHCRRTFRVRNAFGINLKFLSFKQNLAAKHKPFQDHELGLDTNVKKVLLTIVWSIR